MVIEEYNNDWIKQFNQIKEILERNLTKIVKIEHVGSTAIIGMYAKPIIDIDIVIDNRNDFDKIKNELESIGYIHNGDQGIIGREAFKRGNIIKNEIFDKISHHLYVCDKDNEELNRHILFRDYLNKYDKIKNEYNKIKMEIIGKYGNEDRKKYVSIKETEYKWFFDKVIEEAKMEK
jgi:GrpB-like predicted nucleotidyltransferase (UPF0157 family)